MTYKVPVAKWTEYLAASARWQGLRSLTVPCARQGSTERQMWRRLGWLAVGAVVAAEIVLACL